MIRHQSHPDQLRIDTTIKIIEKDGTETIAPVLILVGLSKVDADQHQNVIKIANRAYNRDLLLDRRIKATAPKKSWWKLW